MKHALLLVVPVLLALTATAPMAAGVGVSWGNHCWSDEGARSNLTWACDSNTNDDIRITCSFKPAEEHSDFVGVSVYLKGMTELAAVPDWWRLGPAESGDCRANLITLSADGSFSEACVDPWQGLGGGGIGVYAWNSNCMHVDAAYAVADPVPVWAETEYFAVQFRVSAAKTVNACTGCSAKAIWNLAYVDVAYQSAAQDEHLDIPYDGGNHCVTWQSTTLPCVIVPARNTTWGQVKSLYR